MRTSKELKKQIIMKNFQLLSMLLIIALSSCNKEPIEPANIDISLISNDVMKVNGHIDRETSAKFVTALNNNPDVTTIILTSEGGEVKYSIPIAEIIYDRQISIIVEKYAFSSAFNYFILAAKDVTVNPNSLIGFHGASSTTPAGILGPIVLNGFIKQENKFLEKIGKSKDLYKNLSDDVANYVKENSLINEDFDLFMIGKCIFDKYNINVVSGSYFPSTQEELNTVIEELLIDQGSNNTLNMIGVCQ